MKLIPSLGAAMAVAMLALASPTAAQQTTLRIAGAFGAEHTSSKAMEIFKTELTRLARGSVDVDIIPDMQLGGAKDLIDSVRTGNVFATWVGIAFVSRLVPEVEALSLPFFFDDYDQAMRAIHGPVGSLIEAKLGAKGFTSLAWMELGSRNVTNSKRPLKTLDDFKGLKIRMQPNETHLATFRMLGANPVAMDIKEVYAALRQGDIDGEENPYSVIHANKYFEVQKYLTNTGHFLDLIVFIANKKTFMSLEPQQQKAVREAAAIAAAQQRKMAAAGEAAALAGLKANGMQFDPLPPETRAALRRATAGVIDDVRKRVGAELLDKVIASKGGKTVRR